MSLGLEKEELIKILQEKGIKRDEPILAESICDAIATAISKNNEQIEKTVTDHVNKELGKLLKHR